MNESAVRILVLNPKGGCGKTTIATNLASLYARFGKQVSLMDHDPQGSSAHWLAVRDPALPAIHSVPAFHPDRPGTTRAFQYRLPFDTSRIIIDTPAGAPTSEVRKLLRLASVVVVPILPSPIDIHAAQSFISRLEREREHRPVAVIANRVRTHTHAQHKLASFLDSIGAPLIGSVRDLQVYVRAAEMGEGIFDAPSDAEVMEEQQVWRDLSLWIDDVAERGRRTAPYVASAVSDLQP